MGEGVNIEREIIVKAIDTSNLCRILLTQTIKQTLEVGNKQGAVDLIKERTEVINNMNKLQFILTSPEA